MLLHWFKSFGIASLFFDEVRVFVQPRRIVLMRLVRTLKSGFKQKVLHKQVIEIPQNVEPATSDSDHNQGVYQNLQQCLRLALSHKKWQGAIPTVIVSNHFVRYAVIPWKIELAVAAERQAYMQHCFSLAYGDVAKTWDLRMSEPVFGQPAIASAIHEGLLQRLHAVFSEFDMPLAAVHPHLMLAINQTVTQVSQQKRALTFWLVAIQNGRVCLTLLENGGWRAVKNVTIEADVSEQVTALIQRETVNCNVSFEAPVLLYWPESHHAQPLKLPQQKTIKVLPHPFDLQNSQASNVSATWSPT